MWQSAIVFSIHSWLDSLNTPWDVLNRHLLNICWLVLLLSFSKIFLILFWLAIYWKWRQTLPLKYRWRNLTRRPTHNLRAKDYILQKQDPYGTKHFRPRDPGNNNEVNPKEYNIPYLLPSSFLTINSSLLILKYRCKNSDPNYLKVKKFFQS